MAVKIVPKFNRADIRRMLEERRKRIADAILMMLQRIGEQFVANARNRGKYKDRTGNLRSSVGYVILYNGEQYTENFQQLKGKEGVQRAREVIEELKGNYPRGFVLICIAGMDYAAAVESKGYDVITASSTIAENALRKAVKQIQTKMAKAA